MKDNKVFIWSLYHVIISNHNEPIRVCAPSFISAIKKANNLINSWDNKDKYSIMCIKYVSPCLN